MKRIIVDYAKLTGDILNLLVEKFPDGYDDTDIIRFRNAKNELVEAVEVKTDDTIYLVKVSTKLANRMEKYDEDVDIDTVIEPISPLKGIDLEEEDEDDEEDEDILKDKDLEDDEDDEDDNEPADDFLDEDDDEE